jgi:hypothetical protein
MEAARGNGSIMGDHFNFHLPRLLGKAATCTVVRAGKSERKSAHKPRSSRQSAPDRHENGGFDHVGGSQALILKDKSDVFQHALRLRFDVASHHWPVSGTVGICPAVNSKSPMRTP